MTRIGLLAQWLEEVRGPEWIVLAKRLSANDTGLTESHQVGLYLPKEIAFAIAPELTEKRLNPDRELNLRIVSDDLTGSPRLIYYNNRVIVAGGTRNECRITRFGGRNSPFQNPENTASIACFAFKLGSPRVEAWVAATAEEEDLIETALGTSLTGGMIAWLHVGTDGQLQLDEVIPQVADPCDVTIDDLPSEWADVFPTGEAISAESARRIGATVDPDERIWRRYFCETRLFMAVEAAHFLPRVTGGFATIEEFTKLALSLLNARKSRAGRSLELHLARVFDEENVEYERGVITERGNRPDFILPSGDAYRAAPASGAPDVRMLASKTTAKERWRQILEEADKVPSKHLFTLDEGISPAQFAQMTATGVQLVVPKRLRQSYPAPLRPEILTLAGFIETVRGTP